MKLRKLRGVWSGQSAKNEVGSEGAREGLRGPITDPAPPASAVAPKQGPGVSFVL